MTIVVLGMPLSHKDFFTTTESAKLCGCDAVNPKGSKHCCGCGEKLGRTHKTYALKPRWHACVMSVEDIDREAKGGGSQWFSSFLREVTLPDPASPLNRSVTVEVRDVGRHSSPRAVIGKVLYNKFSGLAVVDDLDEASAEVIEQLGKLDFVCKKPKLYIGDRY